MTWIIPRGDRNQIINSNHYSKIHYLENKIVFVRDECLETIFYENNAAAYQSFGYLMESIKRGDNLANL